MVINGIITGDDFYVNILLLMEYRLLPPFFATKIIYEAIYSSPLFILKRINHILVRSWSSYLFISIFQYVVYTFGAKACIFFFFWKLFSTDCYHSHPPFPPLPEPLLTPSPHHHHPHDFPHSTPWPLLRHHHAAIFYTARGRLLMSSTWRVARRTHHVWRPELWPDACTDYAPSSPPHKT